MNLELEADREAYSFLDAPDERPNEIWPNTELEDSDDLPEIDDNVVNFRNRISHLFCSILRHQFDKNDSGARYKALFVTVSGNLNKRSPQGSCCRREVSGFMVAGGRTTVETKQSFSETLYLFWV